MTPSDEGASRGIALVVTGLPGASEACLAGIRGQTVTPAAVVVVDDTPDAGESAAAVRQARAAGWMVCELRGAPPADAKNAGAAAALAVSAPPLAVAFVDARVRLHPDYVASCERALRHAPDVGLVSFWTALDGGAWHHVPPCPAFPYQLLANEVAPAAAVRADAFREVGCLRSSLHGGFEEWDLVNAVMAAGWVAVTYPAVLAEDVGGGTPPLLERAGPGHARMRSEILARTPDLVARSAADLVLLLEGRRPAAPTARRPPGGATTRAAVTGAVYSRTAPRVTAAALLSFGRRAIRHPRRAAGRLAVHARSLARDAVGRAARWLARSSRTRR